MKGLTKRQRELIDYIEEFIANNRYSPSYREIGQRFGLSSLGSVYKHIQALKKKGLLSLESKCSRSIMPFEAPEPPPPENATEIEIPFIGHIVAGMPVKLFSQTKKLSVPRSLVRFPEKTYALSMQGDFLCEEMIADGDVLIVEVRQEAIPGETVIALVNGNDTIVKKFYPHGDHVRLLSTYTQHNPIVLRREDILVQGIIVALLREYQSS